MSYAHNVMKTIAGELKKTRQNKVVKGTGQRWFEDLGIKCMRGRRSHVQNPKSRDVVRKRLVKLREYWRRTQGVHRG